jgi:hypothetical protein
MKPLNLRLRLAAKQCGKYLTKDSDLLNRPTFAAACRRTVRNAYGFPHSLLPKFPEAQPQEKKFESYPERHSLSALCCGRAAFPFKRMHTY